MWQEYPCERGPHTKRAVSLQLFASFILLEIFCEPRVFCSHHIFKQILLRFFHSGFPFPGLKFQICVTEYVPSGFSVDRFLDPDGNVSYACILNVQKWFCLTTKFYRTDTWLQCTASENKVFSFQCMHTCREHKLHWDQ